ncbi:MAG: hypothetical protein APR63_13520 [Desulfuromonas sp. SDB]|nr:MAG: hypothetical protein APR63_13520 [Desulfuromonas sp. SDB]
MRENKIYQRDIFKKIENHLDDLEAIVITGMRRTGKTTALLYVKDKYFRKNSIYLDLENPLNQKYLESENYQEIKTNFEFLGINFKKRAVIFLDEIQYLSKIPSVVKYFIDHYSVKFFISGSASFYLKNLFSESLSGRKYLFEIFPLAFNEFLNFKEASFIIPDKKISKEIYDSLKPLMLEYLNYGGFPQVVLKNSDEEKKLSVNDIFTSYFQNEIIQMSDFRKNNKVRDLILLLMERVGSKLDYQKLSSILGISRPTLYNYISFLEQTYFISLVKPYSSGKDTEIRKAPKVYLCDVGLLNNVAKVSRGHLFENAVFQIIRKDNKINYYQKKSGVEIDFVLNQERCLEVKINPDENDLSRIRRLCEQLKLKRYNLVGLNYSKVERVVYPFNL